MSIKSVFPASNTKPTGCIERDQLSFRPTKVMVYEFFEAKISKSAIRYWDDNGEFCVIGKFCVVSLEPNGVIDVWICDPAYPNAGLGQKAVKNRLRAFERYDTIAVSELTGEGWVKTKDKDLVLRNLKLLGIRKRAKRSPENLKAMVARLSAARTKQKEQADG